MTEKKYSFAQIILRLIPIQVRATPVLGILSLIMGVIQGGLHAVIVIATERLFDAISDAASGRAGFSDCVIPLLVLAGIIFGGQIMNGIHNAMDNAVTYHKAKGRILALLHRKLKCIDAARFEDTKFLDDLNKAKEAAAAIPYFVIVIFMIVCFYGTFFSTIAVYLFHLKPILPVILLLAFIPAFLSQLVKAKVFTKLEEESAPLRREFEHYQSALGSREYFKETRILGAFSFFYQLFSETLLLLTRKTWKAERKTALLNLLLNIASFAGMAIATYLLFTATMAGEITVGAFAAVFAALGLIFQIMQEIVNYHIGNMNKDIGKLANFVRMLDMPERKGSDGVPDFSQGIVAEKISFTYPGREEPAVRDVSVAIKLGETIAIVGENGAGKSTLVRLLMGIFTPLHGKVTVFGLDTGEINPASIFHTISAVFQKFQRYKMTLQENVSISDTGAVILGSPGENDVSVINALKEADARLDMDLDTMLSPEFDGIDLSGGEWQRLAIARGLYRANHFIVLDEPTSAIDPIEETRVYQQFQRLAAGKCAVIVTHRLGSAKLAHRIIVMEDGRIVDAGTHDELIARPGRYAEMWEAQAKWYERAE